MSDWKMLDRWFEWLVKRGRFRDRSVGAHASIFKEGFGGMGFFYEVDGRNLDVRICTWNIHYVFIIVAGHLLS